MSVSPSFSPCICLYLSKKYFCIPLFNLGFSHPFPPAHFDAGPPVFSHHLALPKYFWSLFCASPSLHSIFFLFPETCLVIFQYISRFSQCYFMPFWHISIPFFGSCFFSVPKFSINLFQLVLNHTPTSPHVLFIIFFHQSRITIASRVPVSPAFVFYASSEDLITSCASPLSLCPSYLFPVYFYLSHPLASPLLFIWHLSLLPPLPGTHFRLRYISVYTLSLFSP